MNTNYDDITKNPATVPLYAPLRYNAKFLYTFCTYIWNHFDKTFKSSGYEATILTYLIDTLRKYGVDIIIKSKSGILDTIKDIKGFMVNNAVMGKPDTNHPITYQTNDPADNKTVTVCTMATFIDGGTVFEKQPVIIKPKNMVVVYDELDGTENLYMKICYKKFNSDINFDGMSDDDIAHMMDDFLNVFIRDTETVDNASISQCQADAFTTANTAAGYGSADPGAGAGAAAAHADAAAAAHAAAGQQKRCHMYSINPMYKIHNKTVLQQELNRGYFSTIGGICNYPTDKKGLCDFLQHFLLLAANCKEDIKCAVYQNDLMSVMFHILTMIAVCESQEVSTAVGCITSVLYCPTRKLVFEIIPHAGCIACPAPPAAGAGAAGAGAAGAGAAAGAAAAGGPGAIGSHCRYRLTCVVECTDETLEEDDGDFDSDDVQDDGQRGGSVYKLRKTHKPRKTIRKRYNKSGKIKRRSLQIGGASQMKDDKTIFLEKSPSSNNAKIETDVMNYILDHADYPYNCILALEYGYRMSEGSIDPLTDVAEYVRLAQQYEHTETEKPGLRVPKPTFGEPSFRLPEAAEATFGAAEEMVNRVNRFYLTPINPSIYYNPGLVSSKILTDIMGTLDKIKLRDDEWREVVFDDLLEHKLKLEQNMKHELWYQKCVELINDGNGNRFSPDMGLPDDLFAEEPSKGKGGKGNRFSPDMGLLDYLISEEPSEGKGGKGKGGKGKGGKGKGGKGIRLSDDKIMMNIQRHIDAVKHSIFVGFIQRDIKFRQFINQSQSQLLKHDQLLKLRFEDRQLKKLEQLVKIDIRKVAREVTGSKERLIFFLKQSTSVRIKVSLDQASETLEIQKIDFERRKNKLRVTAEDIAEAEKIITGIQPLLDKDPTLSLSEYKALAKNDEMEIWDILDDIDIDLGYEDEESSEDEEDEEKRVVTQGVQRLPNRFNVAHGQQPSGAGVQDPEQVSVITEILPRPPSFALPPSVPVPPFPAVMSGVPSSVSYAGASQINHALRPNILAKQRKFTVKKNNGFRVSGAKVPGQGVPQKRGRSIGRSSDRGVSLRLRERSNGSFNAQLFGKKQRGKHSPVRRISPVRTLNPEQVLELVEMLQEP